MPRIAVAGDRCGGIILNTQGIRSTIDGSPIAVVGDSITPHSSRPVHIARIISGSNGITVNGRLVARSGDYASCGHTISASNTTNDSSSSFAPRPPAASGVTAAAPDPDSGTPSSGTMEVTWSQSENYPGHTGAIVQWREADQEYSSARQMTLSFSAGVGTALITGLTNGVEYFARVITTRRFAENAPPSAEFSYTPEDTSDEGGGNE